jgi:cytoskeletal protein RodZ
MKTQKKHKSRKHNEHFSLWLLAILIVLVGLVVAGVLAYSHYRSHKPNSSNRSQSAGTTTEPFKSGSPTQSSGSTTTNNSSGSSSSTTSTGSSTSTPTTVNVITPWGNFVSNLNPSNNSPENQEESVCNSSPGVTCTITFTQGSKTITLLQPKTTNADGAAYWGPWTASQVGLTSGDWQINATASSGNQSKSASGGTLTIE